MRGPRSHRPFARLLLVATALAGESLMPASAAPQEQAPRSPTPGESAGGDTTAAPVFYETTTVTAQPVSSATGAVTVLDAREIGAQVSRSAAEILGDVPGLNLLSSGGRAGVTNAYVRGGDPNFTLVLLDGVPLNDATELQGGAVNLEELPAVLVDHVEIVRGPLTSFYGPNALAGVVQLFTPRGDAGPLRVDSGLEAGDAEARRAFGRVSGPAGGGGFAAGASWAEESHRIGEDRLRQLDLFGSGDLVLGPAATLALSARFADGTTEDYPDASGGPVYGDGRLRHSAHRDLSLGGRLELGEGGRRQRVYAALARRELDRTSPAVPPLVPDSTEHTLYTRLRLGWQLPLVRSPRTELDAGLAGEGEWGDNRSLLQLPPSLGGDVNGDYVKRRATAGAFAGARHQRGPVVLEAAVRLDVASGGDAEANPHAGFVWRLGAETRLRASAGRASKLPSFFALASPPQLGGNPALLPEHVWGGEAGIEHRLRGARLELGATYFRQELHDLIDFDFQQFLHVNRARVRAQGAEITALWQAHSTLSLEGQATYLDVVDLAGGGTLLQMPRWTGGGRLTWRPTPRGTLRVLVHARSGYLDVQYPVPDRNGVEGHGILGAAASWRVADGVVLRARGDNLTGRSYETLIGFPGPGRSFWAGLGWERP